MARSIGKFSVRGFWDQIFHSKDAPSAVSGDREPSLCLRPSQIRLASARLSVPPEQLTVEDGAVVAPGGMRVPYGELISDTVLHVPTPEEMAEKLGMPLEKVRKVLKIAKEPLSLETPIGDEADSHLGDFIEDKNAILPIDAAIQSNLRETTTRVLASLTPREERVLRMRFGIGMNTDHTLEKVGLQFSVTRERIRQIEAKALRKLKHPSQSRVLRSFRNN